jgi:hypothetical protein
VPSTGIMASAVHLAACSDVIAENFTSVADWTGTITSVAGGRTGNAGNIAGSSTATQAIPAPSQSMYVTIGFAYKVSNVASAVRNIFSFRDASNVDIATLRVNINGSLSFVQGVGVVVLGTSATGLIVLSTWYYLEVQVFLANTGGYFTVRRNGTDVITGSGVDTLLDTVTPPATQLMLRGPGSGQSAQFDDLYLSTGAGCAFKGDITVP